MLGLIIRRLLVLIPMMLIVSVLIFALTSLVPGDPAVTLAGGIDARPESVEAIRAELNLDDPVVTRYLSWLGGALTGDFGNSLYSGKPIQEEIGNGSPSPWRSARSSWESPWWRRS